MNRHGKSFKADNCKNIIKDFNEKLGLTCDQAQLKNLHLDHGKHRAGLPANTGKGCEPYAKTFTMDEQRNSARGHSLVT